MNRWTILSVFAFVAALCYIAYVRNSWTSGEAGLRSEFDLGRPYCGHGQVQPVHADFFHRRVPTRYADCIAHPSAFLRFGVLAVRSRPALWCAHLSQIRFFFLAGQVRFGDATALEGYGARITVDASARVRQAALSAEQKVAFLFEKV